MSRFRGRSVQQDELQKNMKAVGEMSRSIRECVEAFELANKKALQNLGRAIVSPITSCSMPSFYLLLKSETITDATVATSLIASGFLLAVWGNHYIKFEDPEVSGRHNTKPKPNLKI